MDIEFKLLPHYFFQMVGGSQWCYMTTLLFVKIASLTMISTPACPPECICLSQTQVRIFLKTNFVN